MEVSPRMAHRVTINERTGSRARMDVAIADDCSVDEARGKTCEQSPFAGIARIR
jgi:hypothetical protein